MRLWYKNGHLYAVLLLKRLKLHKKHIPGHLHRSNLLETFARSGTILRQGFIEVCKYHEK